MATRENYTFAQAEERIKEIQKDCPSLILSLCPQHLYSDGDARLRVTAKYNNLEVSEGHLHPGIDWHTLHMMQSGMIEGMKVAFKAGRESALNELLVKAKQVLGLN